MTGLGKPRLSAWITVTRLCACLCATFDGGGNLTGYGGNTLTYDAENHLTSLGTTFSAGYQAEGLRAWKQVGSTRTYYLYDGDNPIIEMNASGTVTAVNTFGANGLLSRKVGTRNVFYTFDPQGNVAQRLDSNRNILCSLVFDAFGVGQASNADVDPFGYCGQFGYYTDTETGLLLLTERDYDPGTGRFLTRDPSGEAGGVNLYSYTQNNPVNSIDPSGLNTILPNDPRSPKPPDYPGPPQLYPILFPISSPPLSDGDAGCVRRMADYVNGRIDAKGMYPDMSQNVGGVTGRCIMVLRHFA